MIGQRLTGARNVLHFCGLGYVFLFWYGHVPSPCLGAHGGSLGGYWGGFQGPKRSQPFEAPPVRFSHLCSHGVVSICVGRVPVRPVPKREGHKSCLRFCDLTRMTVDHDLNMIGLLGWQKLGKVQLSNEFMDTLTQTNQTNSSRIDCRQTIAVI